MFFWVCVSGTIETFFFHDKRGRGLDKSASIHGKKSKKYWGLELATNALESALVIIDFLVVGPH